MLENDILIPKTTVVAECCQKRDILRSVCVCVGPSEFTMSEYAEYKRYRDWFKWKQGKTLYETLNIVFGAFYKLRKLLTCIYDSD
jgi:hypothetical protein